jgi:hypothetical protein
MTRREEQLSEYLEQPLSQEYRPDGVESDWLDVYNLELRSDTISVGDATFFPHEQVKLAIEPGIYHIQAKVLDYGIDRRISRLRAMLSDPSLEMCRVPIGEIPVGFATVGLCDLPLFLAALERISNDLEQFEAAYTSHFMTDQLYGVIELAGSPHTEMVFVQSGWGAGRYNVYQLALETRSVGIEVVFIEENERYMFEGTEEYQILPARATSQT